MKKVSLPFFLACVFDLAFSQGFISKTNEIEIDFKKNVPNTSALPVVSWVSPQFEYSNSTEQMIPIEATISSRVALKEVKIIIGDNRSDNIIVTKKIKIVDSLLVGFKTEINLIGDGSRFVRFVAENVDGGIVSSQRVINIGMDAIALSLDRKDYALLFATDKYDNWKDLVNPIADASEIERELKTRFGFETELVPDANIDKVFEKIREFRERKYRPQDQLLIFFAGHGAFDEGYGEGYVVAKNSLAKDDAKISYISHNRLRAIINGIPCEHILLVMDVCFGGTLDPAIASRREIPPAEESREEMLTRKLSQKTRKYLTSGGKEYVSDGIPGKHSPFAAKFIESLRTGGGPHKVVTLPEIILNMQFLRQVPRSGSFGDDQNLSDFVFIAK